MASGQGVAGKRAGLWVGVSKEGGVAHRTAAPPLSARKGALLASNGLAVVGGALMGGAKLGPSYILIIIGRFVIGAYSGTAPLKGRRPLPGGPLLCVGVATGVWSGGRAWPL